MARQVQALYDFDAQEDGDLNITVGEIITVSPTYVDEGWLEGTNERGEQGIFPESYVEEWDAYNYDGNKLHCNFIWLLVNYITVQNTNRMMITEITKITGKRMGRRIRSE